MYAAGIARYFIETIIYDNAVARAIDGVIVWQWHTLYIDKLIEEAFTRVLVHIEVLKGVGYGFAEEICIGNQVGEVDGVSGSLVDSQKVDRIYTMGTTEAITLTLNSKYSDATILPATALKAIVRVKLYRIVETVDLLFAQCIIVIQI